MNLSRRLYNGTLTLLTKFKGLFIKDSSSKVVVVQEVNNNSPYEPENNEDVDEWYEDMSDSEEDEEEDSDQDFDSILYYDRETVLRQLKVAMKRMIHSAYFKSNLKVLRRTVRKTLNRSLNETDLIVCYGLGSFTEVHCCDTSNENSIEQFSFLVLLQKALKIGIEFYDPAFTAADEFIISELFNFKVLSENEKGRRPADTLTLFYLPHCHYWLTNGLLHANWSPQRLQNVILIANSFSHVVHTLSGSPSHKLTNYRYIKRVKKVVHQVNLKIKPSEDIFYGFSFSNLSLHVFPPSKFHDVEENNNFWESDMEFDKCPNIYY